MIIEIPGSFTDEQLQNLADARSVLDIPEGVVDNVADVAQAYCNAKRNNLLEEAFRVPETLEVNDAQLNQLSKLANPDEILRRRVQGNLSRLNKMKTSRK